MKYINFVYLLVLAVASSNAAYAQTKLTCNDGDLVVTKAKYGYVATIKNQGVVNFFESMSKSLVTLKDDYFGGTQTVERSFTDWLVKIVSVSKSERNLVITGLNFYELDKHFSTSGPPGNLIVPSGSGYTVELKGGRMMSSHSAAYYDIGEWRFERCRLN